MSTDEAQQVQEEPQMVRTSIYLEEELRGQIELMAHKADRTFSAEIRRALREHVERENGKN